MTVNPATTSTEVGSVAVSLTPAEKDLLFQTPPGFSVMRDVIVANAETILAARLSPLLDLARSGADEVVRVLAHLQTLIESDAPREIFTTEALAVVDAAEHRGGRQALLDAADAIQALHPGEVKASVTFLRDRAATSTDEPATEPGPADTEPDTELTNQIYNTLDPYLRDMGVPELVDDLVAFILPIVAESETKARAQALRTMANEITDSIDPRDILSSPLLVSCLRRMNVVAQRYANTDTHQ